MVDPQEIDAPRNGLDARLIAADGTSYDLAGEQVLGRSRDAEITINNPRISRSHARFRLSDQQLTVEDLGSANGTQVNHTRIEGTAVLRDGDVIGFDTDNFRVEISGVAIDDDSTIVTQSQFRW